MGNLFRQFCLDEQGGGIVEYSLVLALVAIAAITVLQTLSTSVNTKFTAVSTALK